MSSKLFEKETFTPSVGLKVGSSLGEVVFPSIFLKKSMNWLIQLVLNYVLKPTISWWFPITPERLEMVASRVL